MLDFRYTRKVNHFEEILIRFFIFLSFLLSLTTLNIKAGKGKMLLFPLHVHACMHACLFIYFYFKLHVHPSAKNFVVWWHCLVSCMRRTRTQVLPLTCNIWINQKKKKSYTCTWWVLNPRFHLLTHSSFSIRCKLYRLLMNITVSWDATDSYVLQPIINCTNFSLLWS